MDPPYTSDVAAVLSDPQALVVVAPVGGAFMVDLCTDTSRVVGASAEVEMAIAFSVGLMKCLINERKQGKKRFTSWPFSSWCRFRLLRDTDIARNDEVEV